MEEKNFIRVGNPEAGPIDGVRLETQCIRTDFIPERVGNDDFFNQREVSKCSIAASAELGTFSIRDIDSNVMLSVRLVDAMELIAFAMETSADLEKNS